MIISVLCVWTNCERNLRFVHGVDYQAVTNAILWTNCERIGFSFTGYVISFTDWLISFTAGFKDCVVICELLLLFFGMFALAVVVVAVVVIVVVANAVGVVVAATEVQGVAVEVVTLR